MIENVVEEAGSVMLTLASALLFEELTLGGLVKLIVGPHRAPSKEPGNEECEGPCEERDTKELSGRPT